MSLLQFLIYQEKCPTLMTFTIVFQLFLIIKVKFPFMLLLLWGKFIYQSPCRIRIAFFVINFRVISCNLLI
jgi:hypothetical protein